MSKPSVGATAPGTVGRSNDPAGIVALVSKLVTARVDVAVFVARSRPLPLSIVSSEASSELAGVHV